MWKVGLSSSSSCAPGFANLFVVHQRKNVYSSFVARAKWVTQTQMAKQAFFQRFLDSLVLEYCLLCLWESFHNLDENDRPFLSLRSFKWFSFAFQIMSQSNSLRDSSESVFRCKQNHIRIFQIEWLSEFYLARCVFGDCV